MWLWQLKKVSTKAFAVSIYWLLSTLLIHLGSALWFQLNWSVSFNTIHCSNVNIALTTITMHVKIHCCSCANKYLFLSHFHQYSVLVLCGTLSWHSASLVYHIGLKQKSGTASKIQHSVKHCTFFIPHSNIKPQFVPPRTLTQENWNDDGATRQWKNLMLYSDILHGSVTVMWTEGHQQTKLQQHIALDNLLLRKQKIR